MSSILLFRGLTAVSRSVFSPLSCPSLQITRAASLDSAIRRGVRRSNDVGERRPRSHQQDVERATSSAKFRLRKGKRDITVDPEKHVRRSRAARYYDPDSRFGKRSLEHRREKEAERQAQTGPDVATPQPFGRNRSQTPSRIRHAPQRDNLWPTERQPREPKPRETERQAQRGPDVAFPKPFGRNRLQTTGRTRHTPQRDNLMPSERQPREWKRRGDERDHSLSAERQPREWKRRGNERDHSFSAERQPREWKRRGDEREKSLPEERQSREWKRRGAEQDNSLSTDRQPPEWKRRVAEPEQIEPIVRKTSPRSHVPLSIPYTTPASEFLYGTSVVEAALRSKREPRRKLYKLYIYTGENREHGEQDASLELLAKRNGVPTVRLDVTGLRLMDKMSGGRPHNGYILEASPLPKLPLLSLDEVLPEGTGFRVILDHQSREDAAINGISDLIPLPRMRRKPFVLFLDGILDPGNLGGILRTASFLGVTAIAISTRHSASFTPVVLKASAGASENITLFSVSKPAAFITDSKKAGWKIYAAVAPSGNRESVSADDLNDPLRDDPCILMLGSEGEGLRMNLRSKADVELSIDGIARSHGVDSLNVSVAAGILCHAFLRQKQHLMKPSQASNDNLDLF